MATPANTVSTFDNRFARYTVDNHSAPIWIASLLSLIFAFCIISVRLGYVKLNAHGFDDVVLIVAHVRITNNPVWAYL